MGDHYCCTVCTQRYERCTCPDAKSTSNQRAPNEIDKQLTRRISEIAKVNYSSEVNWGKPPQEIKIMLQIDLTGTGDVIDIHKVVGIKNDIPSLFLIEKMKDGGNRLTYNAIRIPDLTKVQGLTFIRQT